MLQIEIPGPEFFDEDAEKFVYGDPQVIQLEHSLLSISKWESRWHKAFLGKKEKTAEEILDYIRCMTITKHVDPSVYDRLTTENIDEINRYISEPMTATYFPKDPDTGHSSETVTAELIYYWMVTFQIPFECQKWHLNRLMALIKVCSVKNTPPKKRSLKDRARLNAERKKRLNTKG